MGSSIEIKVSDFSLSQTLECGQCFRFSRDYDGCYSGVALSRFMKLRQQDERFIIHTDEKTEFPDDYINYFGLDMDYAAIISEFSEDPVMRKITGYTPGIRILRQPLFETLISFIISQNNNIKRISGIVERLCCFFGEELSANIYDFPKPEILASLDPGQLSEIRCGFRDKYIIDAAKKWTSGDIDQETVKYAPLDEARAELMKINGVGPKVADCTLLFGAARFDVFPQDVWIKRAMLELFPDGLPECSKAYAGIAQQYIFHYARNYL